MTPVHVLHVLKTVATPCSSTVLTVKRASPEAYVELPDTAKEGERVTLSCKYDAKGSRLHQIRWFLNGEEFVSEI